jgi:1-deoxy-D-xylulose 5-phosphate reductoisomerase
MIAEVIETTLSQLNGRDILQLETILEDDRQARELAQTVVTKLT